MSDERRSKDEILADLERFKPKANRAGENRFPKSAPTPEPTREPAKSRGLSTLQVNNYDFAPASFIRRAIAFLADSIILFFIIWILMQPIFLVFGLTFTGIFLSIAAGTLAPGFFIALLIGFLLVYGFYLSFTDRVFEGTPGKALMGIRVLDVSTSEPAGFWQYLFRETLGKIFSGLLLGGGYLLALVHADKRALHDVLFFTQVIETKESLSAKRWAIGLGLSVAFFAFEAYHYQSDLKLAEKIKLEATSAWELQRKVANSKAKAVLLSFWSPSCGPCQRQFPHFLELKKKYEPEGLEMIHVALEDESDELNIKRSLGRHGVDFLSYFRNEEPEAFLNGIDPNWSGVIPFTVIYNSNRDRIYSQSGFLSKANLEELIQKALGP